MTLDAVGGVWRYALDLASSLRSRGFEFIFAGFGPQPSPEQRDEAERLGRLVWLDAPLDWMVADERMLDSIAPCLEGLVESEEVDLVHLNLPSQAAGLRLPVPVLVVSHSCVVTWFAVVRGTPVPMEWLWQEKRNRAGFDVADAVIAPSISHASMLRQCYAPMQMIEVVHNGARPAVRALEKAEFVFAAGRWWDDGKNGAVLDAVAPISEWPVVMAGANQGPNGQHLDITHVDWRGPLPHGQTRALMGRAAIVCSPSIYEPFGLVPLEAASTQAALVLADIPTYRELWGGAAEFFDPRDPKALATAINRLVRDPDRREELAARAYARSMSYSLNVQAEAMAEIYSRIIADRRLIRSA
ncbi:glycosyltransferase family 4 protein [Devosia nitrariae]|nr:glycosyltransferase family 4 protein [Devosia nitrariae]